MAIAPTPSTAGVGSVVVTAEPSPISSVSTALVLSTGLMVSSDPTQPGSILLAVHLWISIIPLLTLGLGRGDAALVLHVICR